MNGFDLLIVLGCAVAAMAGYRLGFLARAAGWLGAILGLLAATRLVPVALDRTGAAESPLRAVLTAVALFAGAMAGRRAGHLVGRRCRRRFGSGVAAGVDRQLGAVAGVVVVGLAVWMVTPTSDRADGWTTRLTRGSLLVHQLDRLTPDPPGPLDAASRLLGADQWAALQASLGGGLPDAAVPELLTPPESLDRRVRAATVEIEVEVCAHRLQVGTGFMAAPGLVLTNAHVVAGNRDRTASVLVRSEAGRRYRGRVVIFDPVNDLAAVRVDDLDVEPLPLADRSHRGQTGWVYGHPDGGPLQVRPFLAGTEGPARVPGLYDDAPVTRLILPIRSALDHGDSGSALVSTDGHVVGVAFAISPDDPTLALAVGMASVSDVLDRAVAAGIDAPRVDTGDCLAD